MQRPLTHVEPASWISQVLLVCPPGRHICCLVDMKFIALVTIGLGSSLLSDYDRFSICQAGHLVYLFVLGLYSLNLSLDFHDQLHLIVWCQQNWSLCDSLLISSTHLNTHVTISNIGGLASPLMNTKVDSAGSLSSPIEIILIITKRNHLRSTIMTWPLFCDTHALEGANSHVPAKSRQ